MDLNCTNVNGTLIRVILVPDDKQTTSADDNQNGEEYDQTGAMHFIVATVLVYSILGVFCVLINRIRRLSGRGHQNYLQDESIQRYLKNEKLLKIDGRKTKLAYDCELVAQKVKDFEEKQLLFRLENELSSDFSKDKYSEGRQKRKSRKKKRDVERTLGKMGASLFHIGTYPDLAENNNTLPDDSEVAADYIPEVQLPEDWRPGIQFTIDLMKEQCDTDSENMCHTNV